VYDNVYMNNLGIILPALLLQAVLFYTGYYLQKNNPGLSLLNSLGYSVYLSRGAGLVLATMPALVLFPVCRHTITRLSRYKLFRKYYPDDGIVLHKFFSYCMLFWVVVHAVNHYLNFIKVNELKISSLLLHYSIIGGVTGHLMIISMFFIFALSVSHVRKTMFETFFYFHHFFILFFCAFYIHGIGCFVRTNPEGKCVPYYSSLIFSPFILIYSIEKVYRVTRKEIIVTKPRYFSNDVFKIQFEKIFQYTAGQYIYINCPEVSKHQWHPFTISSFAEESIIGVTIRKFGSWTTDFEHLLKTKAPVTIRVDGPFSSPCQKIYDFDSAIVISTGIGITPYISILKDFVYKYKLGSLELTKIDIICINRETENFAWFNKVMKTISDAIPEARCKFHIYLTQTIDKGTIERMVKEGIPGLNYVKGTDIPLNYGRPDFNTFFNNYSYSHKNINVGCFVCGTEQLQTTVKTACKKYSNENVKFTCISESF
jgi:NADPH oxidase